MFEIASRQPVWLRRAAREQGARLGRGIHRLNLFTQTSGVPRNCVTLDDSLDFTPALIVRRAIASVSSGSISRPCRAPGGPLAPSRTARPMAAQLPGGSSLVTHILSQQSNFLLDAWPHPSEEGL